MAKKVLSIVIGTESTRVCEISYRKNYKNKGIRVFRSISFPTPQNTIDDGYIKDKAAFGEELKNRLREAKFKSDKVIFSIASSKIANREVILPPTKEKRIMDIIRTGASDYFPVNVEDYVLSYYILEKNNSGRKDKELRKKQVKEEKKLAKKLHKQEQKERRKKNKTDQIVDSMEQQEALAAENMAVDTVQETKTEDTRPMKKHMRLSVYAVPSTLVKNYYNFASMMHFDIVSIDCSGNSSYQILKRQANRGTNVFVQMNEQDTIISILQDDVMMLQRNVGYGLSTLTDSVMEQEFFKVNSKEEAFQLLMDKNLLMFEIENKPEQSVNPIADAYNEAAASNEYDNTSGRVSPEEHAREYEARRDIVDSLYFLTNSIVRMLDYYRSNRKNATIDTIYISGSGALIQGIEQYFAVEIGLPVKKMDKLMTVSSNKKSIDYRKNPSEFLSCIGAVIKPINLVPIEFTMKKQKRSTVIATILFSVVCLAGSAGTLYMGFTDYNSAAKELKEIQDESKKLPKLSGVHEKYKAELKELADLKKFEQATKSKNDDITAIITELEKKLPTGTAIHSMQFNESGITMNVTINSSGIAANAIIAKTLIQLKTITYFSNVDVSGITNNSEDGISKVTFTIACTY